MLSDAGAAHRHWSSLPRSALVWSTLARAADMRDSNDTLWHHKVAVRSDLWQLKLALSLCVNGI